MGMIDLDSLLTPIEESSPCGPSLAYDSAYLELEAMAQGTPERQLGDSVIAAEEPNWREVSERSIELLGRTRDLRLMLHLAVGQMETEGLAGLRDALILLRESLERYWEQLHPQLDPEDDNDPLERINIIASLSNQALFVSRLREIPLTNSPRVGRVTLRDLAVASGEVTPLPPTGEDEEAVVVDMGLIDAAFEDTELDELVSFAEAAETAREQVERIDQYLMETVGAASAPDLSHLDRALGDIVDVLRERLSRRGVGEAVQPSGEPGEPGQASAPSGEIRNREDVVRALDRVCRYYETEEPSSPIPLLLRRAQRLVAKSFVEIVRDLTPGAISEVETIGGEDYRSQD